MSLCGSPSESGGPSTSDLQVYGKKVGKRVSWVPNGPIEYKVRVRMV